ncbi:type II toxin-antitoxin system RelE/ParE family toxin [Enterovirga rhinocerotis]|uniref:RelE toxin of RelEB toxin-antitoxin system n=1 Tax=Enterovirga rhinocerotis TaxID=1339210 RepID=A0A4R7C886_9HYPH|nr:type II toxin-antitoxin system RelE/ParE family toxin [Enterovirga rhinocerotis]TDR94571.1 RelE toxin of RelEB toxin-antitoxin system [Enterovirga rhinocerotis]
MHGVIETGSYLADARAAGLDADEMAAIVSIIASDPMAGDLMVGTGGARKLRVARRGKGKSGGYRIVTYFAAEDVPVFLLALIDKGERANLSSAERNELRRILVTLADEYRAGRAGATRRRGGR